MFWAEVDWKGFGSGKWVTPWIGLEMCRVMSSWLVCCVSRLVECLDLNFCWSQVLKNKVFCSALFGLTVYQSFLGMWDYEHIPPSNKGIHPSRFLHVAIKLNPIKLETHHFLFSSLFLFLAHNILTSVDQPALDGFGEKMLNFVTYLHGTESIYPVRQQFADRLPNGTLGWFRNKRCLEFEHCTLQICVYEWICSTVSINFFLWSIKTERW